jgi:hypothetical protein
MRNAGTSSKYLQQKPGSGVLGTTNSSEDTLRTPNSLGLNPINLQIKNGKLNVNVEPLLRSVPQCILLGHRVQLSKFYKHSLPARLSICKSQLYTGAVSTTTYHNFQNNLLDIASRMHKLVICAPPIILSQGCKLRAYVVTTDLPQLPRDRAIFDQHFVITL